MKEITKVSTESINRYFKTLSILGYKNYKEVDRLIILLFIEEFLTNGFADFITDEDYKTIVKSLNCLYGSTCLIDIPSYEVYDSIYHNTVRQNINARSTEDDILRSSNNMLKIKA